MEVQKVSSSTNSKYGLPTPNGIVGKTGRVERQIEGAA
jgi:hypothetical protein